MFTVVNSYFLEKNKYFIKRVTFCNKIINKIIYNRLLPKVNIYTDSTK